MGFGSAPDCQSECGCKARRLPNGRLQISFNTGRTVHRRILLSSQLSRRPAVLTKTNGYEGGFYAFRNEFDEHQESISNSSYNANKPGLDHAFSRGLINISVSCYRIFQYLATRQGDDGRNARSGEESERVTVTDRTGGDTPETKTIKPLQTGLSVLPCR